jgi:protein-S-isoprenylcysteine O-methyltransferase Ste14
MKNIEQTGDAGRPVSGVSISVGLVVRNLLFTVVVPGLGAVWMPWRILTRNGATPKPVSWFALAVIIVGAVLYFLCLWFFAAIGRGTPGPWDAPQRFVAVGPYRWVRNPIYIAALLVVIGEAWLFLSLPLLKYAVAMAVCFHLFVIGYEEPTLHQSKSRDKSTSAAAPHRSVGEAGSGDLGSKRAAFARTGLPPLLLSGDERRRS